MVAAGLNKGIYPADEGFDDRLGVRSVALPLSLHIAAIAHEPGEFVSLDCRWPKNFGEFALAGTSPYFHLPQSVLRSYKTLSKEQIFLSLRVNVRDSPLVAEYLDRFRQSCKLDAPGGLSEHRASLFCKIRSVDFSLRSPIPARNNRHKESQSESCRGELFH